MRLIISCFLVGLLSFGCASENKITPKTDDKPHCWRVTNEDGSTTVCHQITQESFYRPDGAPCPCGMRDTPAPVNSTNRH